MAFLNEDHGDAFMRAPNPDQVGLFDELWPSATGGSGKIVQNNRRTGLAQGKGSFLRKAYCKLCGYPNDLNKVDHSGGSEDGEGAGGDVTKATSTGQTLAGDTISEITGNQAPRVNSGCALCFSKNSSKEKVENVQQMNPLPPFGF